MIWRNPAAWFGMLMLVVPIVAHLFGRKRAKRVPFPSLRFVDATRLLPTRVTRPTDLTLLALRMLIVATAVAALAQPVFEADQAQSGSARSARVIIVDTSLSMQRLTTDSSTAEAESFRLAARIADSSTTSRLVATADIASVLRASADWLRVVPAVGLRQIVILSDFQRGAIDSVSIGGVPRDIGISLRQVQVFPQETSSFDIEVAPANVHVAFRTDDQRTAVRYRSMGATVARISESLVLLAGGDTNSVRALQAAVQTVGRLRTDSAPDSVRTFVTVVYPVHGQRTEVLQRAVQVQNRTLALLIAAIRADQAVAEASRQPGVQLSAVTSAAQGQDMPTSGDPFVILARAADGEVIATAAQDQLDADRLLVFANVDVTSPASLALVTALHQAQVQAVAPGEFEHRSIDAALLRQWNRTAERDIGGASAINHGRWLWLMVLLLLLLESVVRRQRREHAVPPAVRTVGERAA